MFDISALKEMKLSELQDIAKLAKTIKVTGAKKDTLIAQILEHQNNAVTEEKPKDTPDNATDNKSKRARITPETKKAAESNQSDLFGAEPTGRISLLLLADALLLLRYHRFSNRII